MTTKIPQVPAKRVETELPTAVHTGNPKEKERKKMERMADRAAKKPARREQDYDSEHNMFSI